jgi:DNA-binding MarR family transcriptional regulator
MPKNVEAGLVISLISLQSTIQKRVGRALSVHGIGVSEYLVLNQLYMAPTQTIRRSDLAELEKIGLVKKEENLRDARVSLVTLSTAGKQVYEDAQVSFAQASVSLFESLGVEQLETFTELLKTVSRGF